MKFLCLTLFTVFLACVNRFYSQESTLDSLKIEFKKVQALKQSFSKDTSIIVLKQQIAWKLKGNNSDSAILLMNEVIDFVAKKLNSSRKGLLKDLKQQSKSYFKNNENVVFTQKLGDSYHYLGVIYDIQGSYSKSLEYNFDALRIWKILENQRKDLLLITQKAKSSSYGNIGILYEELGDYDKALNYFYICLNLKKKLKDQRGVAITLGSIGTIHYYRNEIVEAKKYYQQALDIFLEIKDEHNASSYIGNLAVVLMDEKKYEEAINLLEKGIEIDKKIDKQRGIASKLGNIGLIYTKINDFSKAEKYLKDALELSKKLKIANVELDHHRYLSELYEKSHKNDLALIYFKNYTNLKDSLKNDDIIKQQTLLEAEFEFEKKQDKILAKQEKKQALLKSEKRKQQLVILFLTILFVLALALVFFIIQFFKRRKKQQEILSAKRQLEIEFKLLRTQMNPHFIFNVLNSIHNYINQKNNDKASVLLLKFSKLIRNILQHSTKEFITLEEELKQLEIYINIEEIRFSNKFTYQIVIQEKINWEEILIPPMILQPFVENAIIHGLAPLKDRIGELRIEVNLNKSILEISISDNGMGIDRTKVKDKDHESLSIKLIEERLNILNGDNLESLKFNDLSQGTQVLLKIPLINAFD